MKCSLTKFKGKLALVLITALLTMFSATATASAAVDWSFVGCNDNDGDGKVQFDDCMSGGTGDEVTSFTDFRGDLQAPDPSGYASGLTQATDARTFILNVTNFALGFLGLLAVVIVIYGGFLVLFSGGEPDKAKKGKQAVMYAAMGILLIMGSFALVNTILLAPSDDESGAGGGGAGESIRGAADEQRFNYLAVEIEAVMREMIENYRFYLTAKSTLETVALNVSNEAEAIARGCDVPATPCVNQIVSVANSQLNAVENLINDSRAHSYTREGLRTMVNVARQSLTEYSNEALREVKRFECDSPNSGGGDVCSNDQLNAIRNSIRDVSNHIIDGALGINNDFKPTKKTVSISGSDAIFKQSGRVDVGASEPLSEKNILAYGYKENIKNYRRRVAIVYNVIYNITKTKLLSDSFTNLICGVEASFLATEANDNLTCGQALTIYGVDGSGGGTQDLFGEMIRDADTALAPRNLTESFTDSTGQSQQMLAEAFGHLRQIYDVLSNLRAINVNLTADKLKGNAPVVVNLSTVGSSDPSGQGITDEQITWDLNGDGIYQGSEEATEISSGSIKTVDCTSSVGATTTCTFNKQGTYRISAKINPKAEGDSEVNPVTGQAYEQDIAPGISFIDVSVNPPTTKIDLLVYPDGTQQKPDDLSAYVVKYEGDNLVIDRNQLYVTLSEAANGLVFDATDTPGKDGNSVTVNDGATVSWNFGVESPHNNVVYSASKSNLGPTQRFTEKGSYTVSVEIRNDNSITDRKIFTLIVTDLAPRLNVSNKTPKVGTEVVLDGSQSSIDTGDVDFNWIIERDGLSTAVYNSSAEEAIATNPVDEAGNTGADYISCENSTGVDVLNCEFMKAGNYTATLELDDGETTARDMVRLIITSNPPIANFTITQPDQHSQGDYLFDASRSSDPDETNPLLEYSWEITPSENCQYYIVQASDQLQSCESAAEFQDEAEQIRVQFNEKGIYNVVLRVRSKDEPDSVSNPINKDINVNSLLFLEWNDAMQNAAQLVPLIPTGSEQSGEDVSSQVNAEPVAEITFIFNTENATSYEIDFGDGQNTAGIISALAGDDGAYSISHKYQEAGKYFATLSVFDNEEKENTMEKRIYIGNSDEPIAIINASVNGNPIDPWVDSSADSPRSVIQVTRKDIILFEGSDSVNTNGRNENLSYSWNIKNFEKQSSSVQVSHSFSDLSGDEPFQVSLRVVNNNDVTQFSEDNLYIQVIGEAPEAKSLVAVADESNNLTTPVTIKLEAIDAKDPDGQIKKYRWYYYPVDSNGNPTVQPVPAIGAQVTTGPQATVTIGTNNAFDNDGDGQVTYAFGLEMTDDDNQMTSSLDPESGIIIPQPIVVTNGPNEPPIAQFTVNRTSVYVGEDVSFTSSSYDSDPDGQIVEYSWDFGDGTPPVNEANTTHVFETPNRDGYLVRLRVTDNNSSEVSSAPIRVYVDAIAGPPVARFTSTQQGDSTTVDLKDGSTADTEADPALSIEERRWDCNTSIDSDGDGDMANDNEASNLTSTSHTCKYEDYGIYRARLMVKDSYGQKDFVTNFVNVKEPEIVPEASESVGLNSSDEKLLAKSLGANLFEASTFVDYRLLLVSIGAYVVLFEVARRQRKKNKTLDKN